METFEAAAKKKCNLMPTWLMMHSLTKGQKMRDVRSWKKPTLDRIMSLYVTFRRNVCDSQKIVFGIFNKMDCIINSEVDILFQMYFSSYA